MSGSTSTSSKMHKLAVKAARFRQYHHVHIKRSVVFEIDTRYTNLKEIGSGSYGLVCSADDQITGKRVAIKKVANVFDDLVDAKRILREIRLLRHLTGHANITAIRDVMTSPVGSTSFKDLYIVTDLFECDLDRIVTSDQNLSDAHHQYFLYQILRGLKYIHSANILHRDLKPSNLLVKSNCDLAICDFGAALSPLCSFRTILSPLFHRHSIELLCRIGAWCPQWKNTHDRLRCDTLVSSSGATL